MDTGFGFGGATEASGAGLGLGLGLTASPSPSTVAVAVATLGGGGLVSVSSFSADVSAAGAATTGSFFSTVDASAPFSSSFLSSSGGSEFGFGGGLGSVLTPVDSSSTCTLIHFAFNEFRGFNSRKLLACLLL